MILFSNVDTAIIDMLLFGTTFNGEHVMGTKRMILGMIVLMAFVGTVRASPVTFEFVGEITSVRDDDNLLGGAVTAGSPFSALYTFESSTEPTTPGGGLYNGAITAVSGHVGEIPFLGPVGSSNSILILDDTPSGGFDNYSSFVGVELLGETLGFRVNLRDSTGNIFTSNSLPLFPPALEFLDPDSTGFRLGNSSEDLELVGDITALVPEPATLLLLGFGALGVTRRRGGRTARMNFPTRR
ncbi:MAG: PEP-CTERM sorting domain-containing protein [Phycisphaerae bacterium]